MPHPALITVAHFVWWPTFRNAFVPEVAMVLELTFVKVFQNALLFFGRFFYALVEFVLRRVFDFLALVLHGFGVPRTVCTPALRRLTRRGNLLRLTKRKRAKHKNQQTQSRFHV